MNETEQILVTRPVVGLFTMQVCAPGDATDEEILEHCNRHNPAGTEDGWFRVIREEEDDSLMPKPNAPIACAQTPGRTHFLVCC